MAAPLTGVRAALAMVGLLALAVRAQAQRPALTLGRCCAGGRAVCRPARLHRADAHDAPYGSIPSAGPARRSRPAAVDRAGSPAARSRAGSAVLSAGSLVSPGAPARAAPRLRAPARAAAASRARRARCGVLRRGRGDRRPAARCERRCRRRWRPDHRQQRHSSRRTKQIPDHYRWARPPPAHRRPRARARDRRRARDGDRRLQRQGRQPEPGAASSITSRAGDIDYFIASRRCRRWGGRSASVNRARSPAGSRPTSRHETIGGQTMYDLTQTKA